MRPLLNERLHVRHLCKITFLGLSFRLHHREKQDTRLHCTAGPSKMLVRPVKCTTLDVHIVYAYNMMRNTPKHLMSFCTASYKPSALSNRQSSLSVPAFYLARLQPVQVEKLPRDSPPEGASVQSIHLKVLTNR